MGPGCGLVEFNVTYSSKASMLTGIYARYARRQQACFYHRLEIILVTSKTLVVLNDYNAILIAYLYNCSSAGRSVNSRYIDLLKYFQLVDQYRLEHPCVPILTCTNGSSLAETR